MGEQLALGLFPWSGIWCVFEVVPNGITAIFGIVQILSLIQESRIVLNDFFNLSIWFTLGSLVIDLSFQKTGITQRFTLKVMKFAGESRRIVISLNTFAIITLLIFLRSHTAVATAFYPIMITIHTLNYDSVKPAKLKRFV